MKVRREQIWQLILKQAKRQKILCVRLRVKARRATRYTFAASQAKKQKLHVIEAIFTFTANQEKEHAEIYYNHLQELLGQTIEIDGGYPVDIYDEVPKLLRSAQHNEYEEHDPVYKTFGNIAQQEGFTKVAASFNMIAEIEKTHGDRFRTFADMLEQNKLFVSDVETAGCA